MHRIFDSYGFLSMSLAEVVRVSDKVDFNFLKTDFPYEWQDLNIKLDYPYN